MTWFRPISALQHLLFLTTTLAAVSWPAAAMAQAAPARAGSDRDAPTTVRAEELTGRPDREVNARHDVEIMRGATTLNADQATYRIVEDEVEATGNVRMRRFGDRYTGDELKLNLDSGQGYVLHPTYRLQQNNAQGSADRLDFESEDVATIHEGTYSTCEGPDPDWYLKAEHHAPRSRPRPRHRHQEHRVFQGRADPGHARHVVSAVGRAQVRRAAAHHRHHQHRRPGSHGAVLFQYRAQPRFDAVS